MYIITKQLRLDGAAFPAIFIFIFGPYTGD